MLIAPSSLLAQVGAAGGGGRSLCVHPWLAPEEQVVAFSERGSGKREGGRVVHMLALSH